MSSGWNATFNGVTPVPIDQASPPTSPECPPGPPDTSTTEHTHVVVDNATPPADAAAPDRPTAPPPSSAADFTPERMLPARHLAPSGGWRRTVHLASFGLITPKPSPVELARQQLLARVTTPIADCRVVAVLSRKGGVGKTTTTIGLGHTFAAGRGDRVIALDANPDGGSLADRIHRETPHTITGLLTDADQLHRYADIRHFTSQASSRLEVVAGDLDPHQSAALGEADYRRVLAALCRHYSLVLADAGTGVLSSATRGLLAVADQLVLVTTPGVDAARIAATTLDWLEAHGYAQLARTTVVALNSVRDRQLVNLDRIAGHFAARTAAVVELPWDPALATGTRVALGELAPATRRAYLELAAAVADQFRTPTVERRPPAPVDQPS